MRFAIIEVRDIPKKRKSRKAGISDPTRDGAPAKKQAIESSAEYEKQVSAQLEKVPRAQVVPTLHLQEDDAEGEGQTATHDKPDDTMDNKMETSDTKGEKDVEEGVKKPTTEEKGNLKNVKKAPKQSGQIKKKKPNKKTEKQRIQSIRDKKKHEEEKLKELEKKHAEEFALVDSLVSKMDKTSKFKQKQVKRKLEAIEAAINHKYEKKRGRKKKTEEIKKLCVEEVREEIRQKKLESREKYKKKKEETGIQYV